MSWAEIEETILVFLMLSRVCGLYLRAPPSLCSQSVSSRSHSLSGPSQRVTYFSGHQNFNPIKYNFKTLVNETALCVTHVHSRQRNTYWAADASSFLFPSPASGCLRLPQDHRAWRNDHVVGGEEVGKQENVLVDGWQFLTAIWFYAPCVRLSYS